MVNWQSRFEKITITFRQSRNCHSYAPNIRNQNSTGSCNTEYECPGCPPMDGFIPTSSSGRFLLCSPNPEFAAGCVRRYPRKMTGGDAQNCAKAIANNHGLLLHTPTELSEHLLYSARRWNTP
jgi:hypothetical protein